MNRAAPILPSSADGRIVASGKISKIASLEIVGPAKTMTLSDYYAFGVQVAMSPVADWDASGSMEIADPSILPL
jgi:hypothetical protein